MPDNPEIQSSKFAGFFQTRAGYGLVVLGSGTAFVALAIVVPVATPVTVGLAIWATLVRGRWVRRPVCAVSSSLCIAFLLSIIALKSSGALIGRIQPAFAGGLALAAVVVLIPALFSTMLLVLGAARNVSAPSRKSLDYFRGFPQ